MSGRYVAGVIIALCTTFMSALGLALQKRAHIIIETRRVAAAKSGASLKNDPSLNVTKQPLWITGIALMAASSLLSLAVFALVGQSVASAFAAVTIVYNLFLATMFLHERLSRLDIVIAAIMVTGTVLAVVFGSRGQRAGFQNVSSIVSTLQRPAAIAGYLIFGGLIVALITFLYFFDRSVASGAIDITQYRKLYRSTLFMRTLIAGLFSGFVGTFSKAVVTSVAASFSHGASGNLTRPEPYIFLVLLLACLVAQIGYLNTALKRFDATEAVPLYQALVVTSGVLFGLIIFNEIAGKTSADIGGFIAGIIIIIIGILTLLIKRRTPPPVLTAADAVRALAAGRQMLHCNAMKRSRSAPASLCSRLHFGSMEASACPTYKQLALQVPVFSHAAGTEIQTWFMVEKDTAKPVSPRKLLRAPAIEENEAVAAQPVGDRRRLAPQLQINCLVPACSRIRSDRARDHLWYDTRRVAAVTDMVATGDQYAGSILQDALGREDNEAPGSPQREMHREMFRRLRLGRIPLLLGAMDVHHEEASAAAAWETAHRASLLQQSLRRLVTKASTAAGAAGDHGNRVTPQSTASAAGSAATPVSASDPRVGRPPAHRRRGSITQSISLPAGQLEESAPHVSVAVATMAAREAPVHMRSAAAAVSDRAFGMLNLPVRFGARQEGTPERDTPPAAAQLPPTMIVPLTVVQTIPIDAYLLGAIMRARHLSARAPAGVAGSVATGYRERGSTVAASPHPLITKTVAGPIADGSRDNVSSESTAAGSTVPSADTDAAHVQVMVEPSTFTATVAGVSAACVTSVVVPPAPAALHEPAVVDAAGTGIVSTPPAAQPTDAMPQAS